jgi:hypothetical protein
MQLLPANTVNLHRARGHLFCLALKWQRSQESPMTLLFPSLGLPVVQRTMWEEIEDVLTGRVVCDHDKNVGIGVECLQ